MSVANFRFSINGSKSDFIKRLNEWLAHTPEGKRYRIKNPSNESLVKIQRGLGLLTAPIIFEFNILKENGQLTEISVKGYIKFLIFFWKMDVSESALFGGLPRRNGWKDMMKIMSFLGIQQQHPPMHA